MARVPSAAELQVDAIVSTCGERLSEIGDEMMRILVCGKMIAPLVAESLYHRVLRPLYGVRALYPGGGRVQIAVSNDSEPASVVYAFDAHMLEVLLDGETVRFDTCAELVDWLKEHVPL